MVLVASMEFFSCAVDQAEDMLPEPERGVLSIKDMDVRMRNATMAFGRAESFSDWVHIFPEEMTLNLENTATGVVYPFVFNPNTLSPTVTITLPYGFYRYNFTTTGGDLEDALLFNASGVFELDAPTYELTLFGTTTYGLVTVKSDLVTSAVLTTNTEESRAMRLRDDGEYYFLYVRNGVQVTLDIEESFSGTDISTTFTVNQYQHYNFIIQPPSLSELSVIEIQLAPFGFEPVLFGFGRISDIDGNIYRITTIGSQVWMAQNLNTTRFRNGDIIPQVTSPGEWDAAVAAGTPAWCYYDFDPANEAIYGKLYNQHAVNDPRSLAPFGYRIPTEADVTVLTSTIGGAAQGGALKQQGTTRWSAPNTGATDLFGFTALPGGSVDLGGGFSALSQRGTFWLSNPGSNISFQFDSDVLVTTTGMPLGMGYSVRAIKQ